jgi:hypothetical protein
MRLARRMRARTKGSLRRRRPDLPKVSAWWVSTNFPGCRLSKKARAAPGFGIWMCTISAGVDRIALTNPGQTGMEAIVAKRATRVTRTPSSMADSRRGALLATMTFTSAALL